MKRLLFSGYFKIHGAEHGSATSRSGCSRAKPITHTGSGIFCCILLVCIFGCAKTYTPPEKLMLNGEVSLNSKPVAAGTISFEPYGAQAARSEAKVPIVNGKYELSENDKLFPGQYLVRISVEGAKVPPTYGEQSTQVVNVSDEYPTKFDFKM
ncbi:MAG: hypothetical protein LBJ00_09740 [Planctomycetaceae bacterium]|jgi:hypothetical protein|nr:hypothetical protein [Planctomycetaceae bacterium]